MADALDSGSSRCKPVGVQIPPSAFYFDFTMELKTLIRQLNLKKHPEGGYYSETYRAKEIINKECLSEKYGTDRVFSTTIYYLLVKDDFSEMHRLKSDEIFHFYYGDSVEFLLLYPNGKGEKIILGNRIETGILPQLVIPAGVWQGIRIKNNNYGFALMGTTVSPGFEFQDYEKGNKNKLSEKYPKYKELISQLTR